MSWWSHTEAQLLHQSTPWELFGVIYWSNPCLRRIKPEGATCFQGMTHVHSTESIWCNQWYSPYAYSPPNVEWESTIKNIWVLHLKVVSFNRVLMLLYLVLAVNLRHPYLTELWRSWLVGLPCMSLRGHITPEEFTSSSVGNSLLDSNTGGQAAKQRLHGTSTVSVKSLFNIPLPPKSLLINFEK